MSDLNDRAELSDRELDALVAEKIFKTDVSKPCTGLMTDAANGSSWSCSACGWYDDHGAAEHKPIPRAFSTDISAAMEVAEKMREMGWSFACTLYEGKLPYASFCKLTLVSSRNAEAESLPRAICLAALSTVREK